MLVDYVIKCSKLNYGMTHKQVHQLAYDNGRRLDCKFPSSWIDNKIVGINWLQCFMKSHKNLTLHKPENTSLFKGTALKETNLMEFFDNYECELKSLLLIECETLMKQECLQLYCLLTLLLS